MESHAPRYLPPVETDDPGPKRARPHGFLPALDFSSWDDLGLQCARAASLFNPHSLPPFNSGHRASEDVND
eukprot:4412316-Lingulodinium_polyedra.AAC.1